MKRTLVTAGMVGLMTAAYAVPFDDIGSVSGVAPQFTVDVTNGGIALTRTGDAVNFTVGANQAYFLFRNTGPAAWSITDIYFDDATGSAASLGSISALIDNDSYLSFNGQRLYGHSGVDFTRGASPANLPQGDTLNPPFETTAGLSADSDSPVVANGIEPDEWLGVVVDLIEGRDLADARTALEAGLLRIGIQAQAVGPVTQRDSFVSRPTGVPDASATAALLGVAMLGWDGLRRKRVNWS